MSSLSLRFCLLLLIAATLAACGPKAVRSPDWLLGEPARYPSDLYLIGVGTAPTSGGLPEALKAAGAGARAELAQTIEVRVDHIGRLVRESTRVEEHRGSQTELALEAERSDLSSFTEVHTEQIVQGIALKEKYYDEKRKVLYVLAVLDRRAAAERLEGQVREQDEQARAFVEQGQLRVREGDLLAAIRLYREGLNSSLKGEVLQGQLRVIDPYRARRVAIEQASGELAVALTDLLLRYSFFVSVEGYPLIEDTLHEGLVAAGFNARAGPGKGVDGLTLWGSVNVKQGTFPSLGQGGGEALKVCRFYLGIKIIDNRSGVIVGQVNLLDNSNAETEKLAEERALRLLRGRILKELPEGLYKALSFEME